MHRGNAAVTGRRDSSQGTDGRRRDGLRGRSPASTPRLLAASLSSRSQFLLSLPPEDSCHLRPRPMLILFSPGGQAVFPPLTHPQRVSPQSEESARRPSPLGCAAPFCPFHAGHIWVWRSDPKPIRLALRAHSKIQCGQRKTQRERRQRAPAWPGFPGTRLASLAAGPPTNRDSGSPPEKEATGFRKPLCHVPFVTLLWQPEIPGFSNFPTSYDLPNPPCPDPRRAA